MLTWSVSLLIRSDMSSTIPLWRRPAVSRLLLIALLAEIGYAVLNISTMPVYLRDDQHIDESWVGLVLAAFLLSEAAFKLWTGHLADRFGHKQFLVYGPLITVFTAIFTRFIPVSAPEQERVVSFVLLRVLDGLGAAMLWPAAFAAMGSAVSDEERQPAMSLLNSCYLLGIALALPIGGAINDLFDARSASLWFAAIVFAFVSLAAHRFVPTVSKDTIVLKTEMAVGELIGMAKRIPAYLALAVLTFIGVGFPMAIIKLFALDQLDMSESAFGLLVLPSALAMALLSSPMSKLGAKMGNHRAVHVGLGLCFIGVSVIASGGILPPMREPWVLAAGGLPLGVGFLLTIPAWMTSVSEIDPSRRAANIGAVMAAQGIGAIIGAPLGTASYKHLQVVGKAWNLGADFGRYSPFMGCAIFIGAGWLLSLRVLHTHDPIVKSPSNAIPK